MGSRTDDPARSRLHQELVDGTNVRKLPFREQLAYNQGHGLFDVTLTNFVTTADPEAHYDKIYSIGAWDKCDRARSCSLAELYRALKSGGRLVHQFICLPTHNRAIELVGVRRYNEFLVFFAGAWRCFNDVRVSCSGSPCKSRERPS